VFMNKYVPLSTITMIVKDIICQRYQHNVTLLTFNRFTFVTNCINIIQKALTLKERLRLKKMDVLCVP
jgi:hypothetical protein